MPGQTRSESPSEQADHTRFAPRQRASPLLRRRSMTMVEMIMVVTIIGILSTVVLVRIGPGTLGRPGVRAFARQLAVDLRYARSLAILHGTNHYVGFDSGGFTVFRRDSPSDVAVENRRKLAPGIGVSITASDFEFEPTGAALAAYTCNLWASGVTFRIRVILATGTITVRKL